jgi:hypothetical protein
MDHQTEVTRIRDAVKQAGAYRAASRVPGLPNRERERLRAEGDALCGSLLEGMTEDTVMALVELLASGIPPGHESNEVLFAIRGAYAARRR